MPHFVAEYKLVSPLPKNWEREVEKLATASGLTASASAAGGTVFIRCGVPANSVGQAGALAKAFFDEAPAALTGVGSGTQVQLMSWGPVPPRFVRTRALLQLVLHVLGFGALVCVEIWLLTVLDRWLAVPIFLGMVGLLLGACFRHIYGANVAAITRRETEAQQAAAEQLKQELARNEDPKLTARFEAARISLRMRAGRMRRDADLLWQRSIWAYRGAFLFFLVSVAGPGIAATLLLRAHTLDWHLMFGGFGLAAVPLTIGTALLRHDAKLREQYKVAADDVATLERYELAMYYARIGAQPDHDTTLKQVIGQLLAAPPASSSTAGSVGKEDLEIHAHVTAVASKLVDAVTTVLNQKKP